MHEKRKSLPLPVRRSMNLTEAAYARLRKLNAAYGFGNNYLLSFLLENLDEVADAKRLDAMFRRKAADYGAPESGKNP